MVFDLEEAPRKKEGSEFPRNLEKMSVGELKEYIEELKAEINRAEADMKKKESSKALADSVFGGKGD
ncbi:MAG: DUF1192 domain-containing protein [Pseudomonadota bacterium]|jgi:uncharacterized small protein (DUF1192 family)|nr:DUF1192 domain-containing protein [Pseudomonadota bacterium]QKK05753.1 MAG: DUF1192 domain-containing protein [Pseudomonadota bacterium]